MDIRKVTMEFELNPSLSVYERRKLSHLLHKFYEAMRELDGVRCNSFKNHETGEHNGPHDSQVPR